MFCQQCGHEVGPSDRFCGNCGHKLEPTQSQGTERAAVPEQTAASDQVPAKRPAPRKWSRVKTVAMWILVIVVAVLVNGDRISLLLATKTAAEREYVANCSFRVSMYRGLAERGGREDLAGAEELKATRFCACALRELRETASDREIEIIATSDAGPVSADLESRDRDAWGQCGFAPPR